MENNKQSKVLPQTGGASTESTSVIAGMLALIFGARLFRRSKINDESLFGNEYM